MNRDEQLKELFQKHWEKTEEERRKELIELGVVAAINPLAKYTTKELENELKRRKQVRNDK